MRALTARVHVIDTRSATQQQLRDFRHFCMARALLSELLRASTDVACRSIQSAQCRRLLSPSAHPPDKQTKRSPSLQRESRVLSAIARDNEQRRCCRCESPAPTRCSRGHWLQTNRRLCPRTVSTGQDKRTFLQQLDALDRSGGKSLRSAEAPLVKAKPLSSRACCTWSRA